MDMIFPAEAILDDVASAGANMDRQADPARDLVPTPTVGARKPRTHMTRSFSDGGNAPKLSPSPHVIEAARRASKDDTSIHASATPLRSSFALCSPSLAEPPLSFLNATANTHATWFAKKPSAIQTASNLQHDSGLAVNHNSYPGKPAAGPDAAPKPGGCAPALPTLNSCPQQHSFATTSPTASLAPLATGFSRPSKNPLSPKVDHAQIYASATNFLPRRSRGCDFSRAATSLHHSTLADQASPESSPTVSGRLGANITGRRPRDLIADQSCTSLWSVMSSTAPNNHGIHPHNPLHDKSHLSTSVGSVNMTASDSSSGSDEDDFMDDDTDEGFVTTPQVAKSACQIGQNSPHGMPWCTNVANSSPVPTNAMNSPAFQRPQRRIKIPKKKLKGPLGLGLSGATGPTVSRSPPATFPAKDLPPHARRESISLAANNLHISSGNESDDNPVSSRVHGSDVEGGPPSNLGRDGSQRPGVIRRAVTRRQNLLVRFL